MEVTKIMQDLERKRRAVVDALGVFLDMLADRIVALYEGRDAE